MKGLFYAAVIVGIGWWGTFDLLARLQAPLLARLQPPPASPSPVLSSPAGQAPIHLDERAFTFCRVAYRQVRREPLGQGWRTDYPDGDRNLMLRLSQLTRTPIRQTQHGEPDHRIVQIMDDELFECPFIFMSDVGTIGIDPEEAERLRQYLEQGGFLWADDFWGSWAWETWTREIAKVLPPAEFPIFDIPTGHLLLSALYAVHEVPQIPSIQFWRRSGRSSTSERGPDSAEPHLRGIRDKKGRLIVVMTHNTDIADGWEREGEDDQFFFQFSPESYALGINIVLYALTH
jgi:hypothetical protein